ncbi:MAG: C45 family autoproteolytic acyltransferase/hydrolase [Lachnospiraceae bacterium]
MKMSKKRKVVLGLSSVLFLCLIVFPVGAWMMFGEFITAANTIREQERGLYSMEYAGDYGFDEFLARGGAASDAEVANYLTGFLSHGFYRIESDVSTGEYGCSTICTTDENGAVLFGRNYDWEECSALIVHTKPENGYESVSTCCPEFLGFGEDYTPDGSMAQRMMTLAAIYVPLDGMNEKGLVIADLMAGDKEETHQNTGKADLTTTTAIRLLLDRAANVDEAIELLKQYDMNSSIGFAHHFSIADASGKSVVVEYIDGEPVITETKIVTNHYLAEGEKYGIESEQSHERFDRLAQYSGSTDQKGVREMLKSVAQFNYPQSEGSYEKTMWSVVYTPSALTAEFYFRENYDHSYIVTLSDKGGWITK